MFNLLIVDDFEVDRQILRESLTSIKGININIVGDCENGKKALEFIENSEVHIVISDIEMPFMNGLEFAKNINLKYPNIKIIFCSLYDEFEYARKALFLNTYGYILKPIDKDELYKCIISVTTNITNEIGFRKEYNELKSILEKSRPQLLDNLIKEIVYGEIDDEMKIWDKINYLGVKLEKGFFMLVYVEIDNYDEIMENKSIEQKQLFTIKIFEKAKELSISFGERQVTILDDSHFVYIGNSSNSKDMYEKCNEFATAVTESFRITDISTTISISDICESIKEVNKLLQQCIYTIRYKFTLGSGKVLRIEDIPSGGYNENVDLNKMQKDIRFLINSGSMGDIEKYVENLLKCEVDMLGENYIRNLCFSVIMCVVFVLNENNESLKSCFNDISFLWKKLLKFETIVDARIWIYDILVSANRQISNKASNKYKLVVEEVKRIVQDNYMKGISVEFIADKINYSPNYLSYVFKKESGETISDYISKWKIEKAKVMLLDIRNRIYNISEALGFSNTAYFCSVFKRITFMTPNEYREKNLI